jgi:hypothetical protein
MQENKAYRLFQVIMMDRLQPLIRAVGLRLTLVHRIPVPSAASTILCLDYFAVYHAASPPASIPARFMYTSSACFITELHPLLRCTGRYLALVAHYVCSGGFSFPGTLKHDRSILYPRKRTLHKLIHPSYTLSTSLHASHRLLLLSDLYIFSTAIVSMMP